MLSSMNTHEPLMSMCCVKLPQVDLLLPTSMSPGDGGGIRGSSEVGLKLS